MIIEFRASKKFYWKQSKWDQQKFILIFLLKLCLFFFFICLLKILDQKATVSKETVGSVVWNRDDFELYQTLFHNKNFHNRLFNSTILFVVYNWPWKIETVVIRLNQIKLKCLKFCFLNSVAFCARTQIKVDLKLKSFSRDT